MFEQIRANQRRSAMLIAVMAALLVFLGYALGELAAPGGGWLGVPLAVILWLILTAVSYFQGDRIFLAASGAKKIEKQDHPVLLNIVEEMTIAAGLAKPPEVYIIEDDAPNAFATGRKPETAAVAVTTGLLETLTRDELQGVVAHEIAHVKNRDILYMTLVGIMMGAIVLLADLGLRQIFFGVGRRRRGGGQEQVVILAVALVLIVLAPILARLLYFACSRKREYLADASAAQFTRFPEGLASALEKISGSQKKLRTATRATAPMFIVNPLQAAGRRGSRLFSTHPPAEQRVRILRGMGGHAGLASYEQAFRQVTGRPVGVVPAGSLRAAEEVEARKPRPPESDQEHLDWLRGVRDLHWRLLPFFLIACACGTKLKIPEEYAGRTIDCPHCQRPHPVEGSPHAPHGRD